jgi:hypothetical protein
MVVAGPQVAEKRPHALLLRDLLSDNMLSPQLLKGRTG